MILYCLTRGLVRASIILFYLRLFPRTADPKTYRLIVGTALLNALHITAFALAILLLCQPVSFFWHQWDQSPPPRRGRAVVNGPGGAGAGTGIGTMPAVVVAAAVAATGGGGEVPGKCGDTNALAWAASVVGIVFDVWLMVLPWPGLWKVNLGWKRRVEAGVMLLVGLS